MVRLRVLSVTYPFKHAINGRNLTYSFFYADTSQPALLDILLSAKSLSWEKGKLLSKELTDKRHTYIRVLNLI